MSISQQKQNGYAVRLGDYPDLHGVFRMQASSIRVKQKARYSGDQNHTREVRNQLSMCSPYKGREQMFADDQRS
jgi:hypothetical protein